MNSALSLCLYVLKKVMKPFLRKKSVMPKRGKWSIFGPNINSFELSLNLFIRFFWNFTWWQALKSESFRFLIKILSMNKLYLITGLYKLGKNGSFAFWNKILELGVYCYLVIAFLANTQLLKWALVNQSPLVFIYCIGQIEIMENGWYFPASYETWKGNQEKHDEGAIEIDKVDDLMNDGEFYLGCLCFISLCSIDLISTL